MRLNNCITTDVIQLIDFYLSWIFCVLAATVHFTTALKLNHVTSVWWQVAVRPILTSLKPLLRIIFLFFSFIEFGKYSGVKCNNRQSSRYVRIWLWLFLSEEALRLFCCWQVNSGVQRRCWCGSCGVSKKVGCVLSALWLPKHVRQPQLDVSCDVHVHSRHFAFKEPQTSKQPLIRCFYISYFQSINLSALTSCHSASSTSAYLAELAIKQQLIFWRKSHLCLMPLPGLNPHVSLLYSLNMVGRIRSGDFLAHFEKQNWFYLTKYGCFICFEAACFCNRGCRAPHEQLMPSVSRVN